MPRRKIVKAEADIADNGNAKSNGNEKISLAKKKKLKQKQRKQAQKAERQQQGDDKPATEPKPSELGDVVIEYVSAPLDIEIEETEDGPTIDVELSKILERFGTVEQLLGKESSSKAGSAKDASAIDLDEDNSKLNDRKDDHNKDDADEDGELHLSRRKQKLLSRVNIAQLKQACERPEVVEVWDATATDPSLLVQLKAYRNTVPVPVHWSQKRAYLSGKKGLDKPPFQLPAFIEATGITEMRNAYLEKVESQSTKAKGRTRTQPKMGKLDIDYQVLHDAFFRHQTKPTLTKMGDLYFEGKEYDVQVRTATPGVLSERLRAALGMEQSSSIPPPWLINMQRYGPPPSYPSLRIQGLNAPIPHGAQFGYHAGGWGKPPVDEEGDPIYGDVFGEKLGQDEEERDEYEFAQAAKWGDLDEEEEEEESEEEEEEESSEEEEDEEGGGTLEEAYASAAAGAIPGGIETPREVHLRKAEEEEEEEEKHLYQVLEKEKAAGQAGLMGSEYTYSLPGGEAALKEAEQRAGDMAKKRKAGGGGGGGKKFKF